MYCWVETDGGGGQDQRWMIVLEGIYTRKGQKGRGARNLIFGANQPWRFRMSMSRRRLLFYPQLTFAEPSLIYAVLMIVLFFFFGDSLCS